MTNRKNNRFPQYLAYVDFTVAGGEKYGMRTLTKALEQTTLTEAMRHAENAIAKDPQSIYVMDILEKTAEIAENGTPIYRTSIMTRVQGDCSSKWYFRDEQHGETDLGAFCWIPTEGRNGILEYCGK